MQERGLLKKRGMPSPDEGDAGACFSEPVGSAMVGNPNFHRPINFPRPIEYSRLEKAAGIFALRPPGKNGLVLKCSRRRFPQPRFFQNELSGVGCGVKPAVPVKKHETCGKTETTPEANTPSLLGGSNRGVRVDRPQESLDQCLKIRSA